MQDFKKGEWKVILGSEKKRITHPTKKTTRATELFAIVTSDNYQLILREWEIGDKDDKGSLEIDGVYYKKYGNDETFHKDFGSAVNRYLSDKKFKPEFDIKTVEDVEKLYEDLNKEGEELYRLKKY